MVTYLELNGEPEWDREFTPPNLQTFVTTLRAHFKVGPTSIGCKGDNNHLRGYHRSDEWLANSDFCTNRTYSRSETPGNREPGDRRWLCAVDIGGMPLIEMCRRLDPAVKSGRFEKITEWYGNLGGDLRVDGYNNILNRLATSDSSHLYHLHLSFDRARVNEDHSDLLAVLIGDDMTPEQALSLQRTESYLFYGVLNLQDPFPVPGSTAKPANVLAQVLRGIATAGGMSDEEFDELVAATQAAALAGAQQGSSGASIEEIETVVTAAAAETRDAVADLGEGGSAQVRADA
jgi:hypothetical protein